MPLFRKKPVVIEAEQTHTRQEIHTLEGVMVAEPGDWIITGVKGEKYPCKPDVFAATYEPMSETTNPRPWGLSGYLKVLPVETVQPEKPEGECE